jgi:beta-carotene 15,15'-dioxygenase
MTTRSLAALSHAAPKALLGIGLAGVVVVLDHLQPRAGLVMLLVLVGSVGTAHGVLDALLMARHLQQARTRRWAGGLYLLATVLGAVLLQPHPGLALLLLLGLSIWHFGERFGRPAGASAWRRGIDRLVRGGAPVLMPALLARSALEPLVGAAAAGDAAVTALVWACWSSLAFAWLCLVCGWLSWVSLNPRDAVGLRQTAIELGALAALNLLVSPLMAFALYFGIYHAGGHIVRVLAESPAGTLRRLWQDPRLLATLALTLLLGALLAVAIHTQTATFPVPDIALRGLILALAAISIPHVLLISWWARLLSGEPAAVFKG